MIKNLTKISIIMSELWFESLRDLCVRPNFEYQGYYGCIDLVNNLSIEFYKEHENNIEKDEWRDIITEKDVDDYRHLIELWTKETIFKKYNFQL